MKKTITKLEKEIAQKVEELAILKKKKAKKKEKTLIKTSMQSIFRTGSYPKYHFATVCVEQE